MKRKGNISKKKKTYTLENIKSKLEIIKEAVLRYVPAEKIYVFSSYVYGKPNKNSDIDIYIVAPDDFNKGTIETMGKIAGSYFPEILNADLFFRKKSDFLFRKEISSVEDVNNKGIILYENK